jgi:hypothetical protein
MLAKETGWSEAFILWDLPLSRALGYYHAALRERGLWTVKRQAPRLIGPVIPRSYFDAAPEEDEL